MTKPHTSLWIMFARGREYDVKEAIKKAPKAFLEKMLEQMMWESDLPVWDSMVEDHGYPFRPQMITEPKTQENIPREQLDAQLALYGYAAPHSDIAPLANGDSLDITLRPIITDN